MRVTPWHDPVVDRRGHDPRSAYVEQFWLGVLGPTATWLLRRLVAGFDHQPDGYELDVAGHRPRPRAQRRQGHGVAVHQGAAALRDVRARAAALRRLGSCAGGCRRLAAPPRPAARRVQSAHDAVDATTIHLDALARAHALAAAMLAAGDDRGVLEPQLVAVGVPAPAAAEACELSTGVDW